MSDIQRNVFISHYGKDEHHIDRLTNVLEARGYKIRNSSITSDSPNNATNDDYIESLLRPKIDWASRCIVLINKETASRGWVDWEIRYAHRQGKRIVGVFCSGGSDSDVPEALNDYGHALVSWSASDIEDAIEGENSWCRPDGSDRPPVHVISRVKCQ